MVGQCQCSQYPVGVEIGREGGRGGSGGMLLQWWLNYTREIATSV